MAYAYAHKRSDTALSDINITPLVDVMLVMLVIFMISAPVLTRDIPLTLPQVGIGKTTPPPPLELRIEADGEIRVAGQPMPMSALPSVLSAERERAAGMPVVLDVYASGDVNYQAVASVLAAANNAGLGNIRMK